jgi:RimJ/RimL family protein N-acetyltransferase
MISFGFGATLSRLQDNLKFHYKNQRNIYGIWKWCRQYDLIDDTSHSIWFEKQSKDASVSMYQISSPDGHVVGVCGLTDIDKHNQRAEFSLYTFNDQQSRGYGKAALKTLLSHGFMNHNLNVIWGETFEGNPAYDMFLKLGMKHEGTRRQFYFKDGKHIDAHVVSITRQEFMEAPWKTSQQ